MAYVIRQVDPGKLDLGMDLFSCSYPRVFKPLEESMTRTGLLKPISVIKKGDRLVVASGMRRAVAARNLGISAVDCMMIEKPVPSDTRLFFMNLEDNIASRQLNVFEKALAVKRICHDLGSVEDADRDAYLRLLGLSPEREEVRRMMALDGLDMKVKGFVLERSLPERFALVFTSLPTADAVSLVDVAARMRLTAGQIRETAMLGKEISGRDKTAFQDVIRSQVVQPDSVRGKGPDVRSVFLESLRRKRYPDYSEAKNEVERCLDVINGVAGIRITPPPYMEGDEFSARVTFKCAGDLESRARTLLDYAGSKEISRVFNLLDG